MTIDKDRLKALAEAACPGPWSSENEELYWHEDGYTKHLMETSDGSDLCHDQQHRLNLSFISAANPETVLGLLAEIERLDKDSEDNRAEREIVCANYDKLKADNESLRKIISDAATACGASVSVECTPEFMANLPAEISVVVGGLRKDAERYRWLREPEIDVAIMFGGHAWEDLSSEYIDLAIDAAMSKERGQVVSCGPDVPVETRQALEREGFKVLDHNHKPWRNELPLPVVESTPERHKGPRNRWGNLR